MYLLLICLISIDVKYEVWILVSYSLYWIVCYRLKNDTNFENTVPERTKSYINIKGVNIGQKYDVILVAVDGNNTRESDIYEIGTMHSGIHNYGLFSKNFPSIFMP